MKTSQMTEVPISVNLPLAEAIEREYQQVQLLL